MRIISLNANGIRSAGRKGVFDWLARQQADVVCIQETKAQEHQLEGTELYYPPGYHCAYEDATVKKGYSGVAIYCRQEPDAWVRGFGSAEFDPEGRYLEARFGDLSIVSLYLPSGSSSEERQQAKYRFLDEFLPLLRERVNDGRRYVLCGDWNIAHQEIDLKNWKSNQKNSGFLPEERAWMTQVLDELGWLDAYRELHPEATGEAYTWWSNRGRARENNVGWRIDYQIVSPAIRGRIRQALVYKDEFFSDHAPLIVDYDSAGWVPGVSERLEAWLAAAAVYRHPRVVAMLFLGFSAGLPFLLVFSTLSAWLTQAGIDRATIGMLSWVGLAYTVKFFWAPVVDRLPLPFLTRALGRRRSWMLLAQAGIAAGLVGLALHQPADDLLPFVWLALLVAFSSATQDIAIDAWRIEAMPQAQQGAMAATYQLGYRLAIVVAGAGALWIAAEDGWHAAYLTMAALVGIGAVTTLLVAEPQARVTAESAQREQRVIDWLEAKAHWPETFQHLGAWFIGAVVCPFIDFVQRMGPKLALLVLMLIGSYRLTDFTMGVMANPFYLDIGYSLKEIAAIVKGLGVFTQILGAVIGGIVVARLGTMRSLLTGSLLVVGTNLCFLTLALAQSPDLIGLALVIGADNLAMGVAGTALIAYLSGLTSPAYTATQYALFSSMFALPGKLLMGGSGFVVQTWGYPVFFVYTTLLGLPALLLILYLIRKEGRNTVQNPT